jgi:hypothetical protein
VADEEEGEEVEQRVLGATWTLLGGTLLTVLMLFSLQCPHGEEGSRSDYPHRTLPPEPEPVLLAGPEPDDDYFPCTDCHDETMKTNRERRALEDDHEELEVAHGDLWCLQCHSADLRDSLQLSDGSPVAFGESWQLCTQCHGQKLADWRSGVHGKRTGHWWGPKEYRTCIECHDPHAPRFESLVPLPPPHPPERIRRASVTPEEAAPQEVADEAR